MPSDHIQDTTSGTLFTVISNLSYVTWHKTTRTTKEKEKHEIKHMIEPSKSVKNIIYTYVYVHIPKNPQRAFR